MLQSEILAALRLHRGRLAELGVLHAGVFGSTARGEGGAQSDIDVLIELEPNDKRTLFDLVAIERAVSEVLPMPLDIAFADQLKPAIASRVHAETIRAF